MSYYEDDECNVCMHYVAFFTDANVWSCVVCELTETIGEWGRYRLPCGHQAHIRCFRRWCKANRIGCVACGTSIDLIPQNEFCFLCQAFGHSMRTCMKNTD